jgi:hypothetical protein
MLKMPRKSSAVAQSSASAPDPPRRNSPYAPPPLYPIQLSGYKSSTAPSSQLLSRSLAEEIRLLIPPRLQLHEKWKLLYSLEQNGVSLSTLYEKCEEYKGLRAGFVLVVRDGTGNVSLSWVLGVWHLFLEKSGEYKELEC